MKVSYDWLKDYCGNTFPALQEVANLIAKHSFEVEEVQFSNTDSHLNVIDIDVLPNRSSDCLSHRGIAREIATLTEKPLAHDPFIESLPQWEQSKVFSTTIDEPKLCKRFSTAVIENVKIGPSPDWLKERLEALGQKSINNVVDATNYVMYALGQPTHAFDLDKLAEKEGTRNITIRLGRPGEKLTILTGEEYESDEETLHLVDGVSDVLLDFAGIKGGKAAELTEATTNIVVTSGNFDYVNVRRTSQRFRISTDASHRFQNEPSRELTMYGLRDVVKLILELAGGTLEGYTDAYKEKQTATAVDVSVVNVNALLGLDLSNDEMKNILLRVGCTVTEDDDGFTVVGPWERTDLTIEEDFIEEIGRVYGYDHVKAVVPETVPLAELNVRHYYSEKVREALIAQGFSEVITSSFRKKDELCLFNALASDKGCLRSNLAINIAEALEKNIRFADLLGSTDVKIFEIGTVFTRENGKLAEHMSLCLGVRSKVSGFSKQDDEKLQTAIAEITRALGTDLSFDLKEGIAEIDFSKVIANVPAPNAYDPVPQSEEKRYMPFSAFPHISRDIALWVPEDVTADEVMKALNEHAGPLRVRTTLFDEFKKDGRTSYAFRLVFQSNEKTLTDSDINSVMDAVYAAVEKQDWEVR